MGIYAHTHTYMHMVCGCIHSPAKIKYLFREDEAPAQKLAQDSISTVIK